MAEKNDSMGLVEDGLLSVSEAQEFTRLSRSDIYARMERGELAYCKLGRRRLIPRRALIDWLKTLWSSGKRPNPCFDEVIQQQRRTVSGVYSSSR